MMDGVMTMARVFARARSPILSVYRYHLREICARLEQLVEAIANPGVTIRSAASPPPPTSR